MRDIHTETAMECFNVSREEVTPEMRKYAKQMNYWRLYGHGSVEFSKSLDAFLKGKINEH